MEEGGGGRGALKGVRIGSVGGRRMGSNFDALVDGYLTECEKIKCPLTLTGALLYMGIYNRNTLDSYEKRPGFGAPVKRLRAMVAAAGARMDGIEALVADMARRVNP